MNLKSIVKDNTVQFSRYRQGHAYYEVSVPCIGKYIFPVPLDDIGDATLPAQDKAIVFMRYIRQSLDNGTFVPMAK